MRVQTSFALLIVVMVVLVRGQRYQRLMQPSEGAKLTITPGVKTPTVSTSTIESLFSMKMPISIRFPTMAETAASFFGAAINSTRRRPQQSEQRPARDDRHETRINSRARFYESIEKTSKKFGKACLLRAICEVAETPFVSSTTGIIGELVDILLTSSFLNDKRGRLSKYRFAELLGKKSLLEEKESCKTKYKGCPFSLFKIMEYTNDLLF